MRYEIGARMKHLNSAGEVDDGIREWGITIMHQHHNMQVLLMKRIPKRPPPRALSVSVGSRGPILLEDYHLVEKLAHFHRERIPERVVHARGSVAKGFFEVQSMGV